MLGVEKLFEWKKKVI